MAMTASQIVRMPRCEDYSDERVRRLVEGRERWEALDILRHTGLTPSERLWLLVRGSFLDDAEKIEAACRIAEHVLPMFEAVFPHNHHPRRALRVARRAAHGTADLADQLEVRSALRASLEGIEMPYCVQGAADAAAATADPDPDRALRHASTCARAAVGDDGDHSEVHRQLNVLRNVCLARRVKAGAVTPA